MRPEAGSDRVSHRGRTRQTLQLSAFLPVAEEEAAGEGDDEEDDRDHHFKLLIFVFVGKSVRRGEVKAATPRGLEGNRRAGTHLACLLRSVTLTFPKTRLRYNLQRQAVNS